MRSKFFLFSVALTLLALIAFGGVAVRATPLVQATMAATGTMMSGTMTTYPACPASSTVGSATQSAATNTTATTSGNSTTGSMTPQATTGSGNTTGSSGTTTATAPTGGYLGIEITIVETCGVRVNRLLANSPASAAGIQVGDVIVAVDNQSIVDLFGGMSGNMSGGMATMSATTNAMSGSNNTTTTPANATNNTGNPFLGQVFFQSIQQRQTGDMVTLTIQRGGQQLNVSVTLGAIPPGLVTPIGGTAAVTGGSGGSPTQSVTATP
jgi:membrane-associated protease RseP (regulator of RpoE activity)